MDNTESERAKYQAVWTDPRYRIISPGLRHLKDALEWMQPEAGASVTDWGSGSGQATDAMVAQGYAVRMVDIAANAYEGPNGPVIEACLWELPAELGATDYGFCADVMEHLPPDKVEEVFAQIAARTTKACYFQIALFHDSCFTDNGPLHLSVFPPEWWEKRLRAAFSGVEIRMVKRKHLLAVCTV
ncbi:class I SAM-dependent methyltransferase [Pseudoxanthomonas sacheonensis]|uniref:class I SAM-dependent methyltransferase n=1 Tax=Pseudoxanthomonas sacheonensis TaxID=443615 RepID=UPI0013D45D4E|nr:class I SAM-dependent methyltransferase [Pseudoxanthomonas sacheonensis]KAF1706283.1 hypothetical protein CSC73_16395 [Pseudoxanthomonas sacheonensis]